MGDRAPGERASRQTPVGPHARGLGGPPASPSRLRRNRWTLILGIAIVCGGFAILLLLSQSPTPTRAGATVRVGNSSLGRILVDRAGLTLYLYTRDGPRTSVCSGTCRQVWPPATVSGKATAGTGASVANLGTIKFTSSARQLIYKGHPLYRFSGDTHPGQMDGEGFLGVWYAVSPSGTAIRRPGDKSGGAAY
jgi:predicted lipoprotein with Yx(FWY)xxD motif